MSESSSRPTLPLGLHVKREEARTDQLSHLGWKSIVKGPYGPLPMCDFRRTFLMGAPASREEDGKAMGMPPDGGLPSLWNTRNPEHGYSSR